MPTKNDPSSRVLNYVRAILFEQRINHYLHEKAGTDGHITLLSPTTGAVTSIHFDKGEPGAEKGTPEGPHFVVHQKATATSEAVTSNFTTIQPLLQFLNVDEEKINSLRIKFVAAQAVNDLTEKLTPRMGM